MPNLVLPLALVAPAFLLFAVPPAHATPSTAMWAPATPAIQPFGVVHAGVDTYVAGDAAYPVDYGLTVGVLPFEKLQLELGIDLVFPTVGTDGAVDVPLYLNGKLGTPEDTWFRGQPGWSVGIYNLGLESGVTDVDVLYAVVGKTLPYVGTLAVGGYFGLSDTLLLDRDGDAAQAGLLASWTSPAITVPKLDKLVVVADLQTGRSSLGGIGAGVAAYITPGVALLTGPVFFLAPELQPGGNSWMWSVQLDLDLDLK